MPPREDLAAERCRRSAVRDEVIHLPRVTDTPGSRGSRIAVLIVQYLAENSGSWQVLRNLLERLDPGEFRIVLVLPEKGEVGGTVPSHVAIRYSRIPRLRARGGFAYLAGLLFAGVRSILDLRRIIRHEGIDIVHCNSLPNVFAALAAVSTGRVLVWHVHELEFRPRVVFGALVWLCGRLADRIVCVSKGVRDLFGGSPKAVLIYNGIDVNRFRPDAASGGRDGYGWIGVRQDAFVVTQLGRIVPIKGVEWFIALAEAFVARQVSGVESVRFVLVGGLIAGHEEYFSAMLRRMDSSPARDHLIYVPALDDPLAILAATHVLVQSSVIAESFGRNLVEAMAMGKPVLASPMGGPAEIIRDGIDGFLVSPRDVQRRADILEELFRDRPRLARLGAAARGRAYGNFSADRMASDVCGLYRSLCASTAGVVSRAR
ncbi:MAG: glycosyltransferase family 4 protein [candidate division NC10 bacterium]